MSDAGKQAAALTRQEPYTKYGQRDIDVMPWHRNEGSMQLNLSLADGVLEIDNRRGSIGPALSE